MASIHKRGKSWYVQFYWKGDRLTVGLGRLPKRAAEQCRVYIERLLECRRVGVSVDAETARWLAELDDKVYSKLAELGFVPPREDRRAVITLRQWLADYIAGRKDVKPETRRHYQDVSERLLRYFGADTPITEITAADADRFAAHLRASLALNTVNRILGRSRQFFEAARRAKIIADNPFSHMRGLSVRPNHERIVYVPVADVLRVMDACPNPEWRALFALARFAGLRIPSEIVSLAWEHVVWDRGVLVIYAPKTDRRRVVPMATPLRTALEELWDWLGAQYPDQHVRWVLPRLRELVARPDGLFRNANLRTRAYKILDRAGIKPWPKLFQNLRTSCAIDLARARPQHLATEWMGHTADVAREFYLRATDDDYAKGVDDAFGIEQQRAAIRAAISDDQALSGVCSDFRKSLRRNENAGCAESCATRRVPPPGLEPGTH